MEHIYKCGSCKKYTLEGVCPSCSSKAESPRPPKFSLSDKYASYRRIIKKKELSEKNLY